MALYFANRGDLHHMPHSESVLSAKVPLSGYPVFKGLIIFTAATVNKVVVIVVVVVLVFYVHS